MRIVEHDVVVLGGGPGGYVAAIRAAQRCERHRGRFGDGNSEPQPARSCGCGSGAHQEREAVRRWITDRPLAHLGAKRQNRGSAGLFDVGHDRLADDRAVGDRVGF